MAVAARTMDSPSRLAKDLDAVRISPRFGGAEKCTGCDKSVYHAERCVFRSAVFHKACLKCSSCSKVLTPGNVLEHAGDPLPWCKACHSKSFGPKGVGYGGSMSGNYVDRYSPSPTRSPSYVATVTTRSSTDILADAQAAINSPVRSLRDETPTKRAGSPLKETSLTSPNKPEDLTNKADTRPRTPKLLERSNSSTGSTAKTITVGAMQKCRRCGETSYFAETIVAAGNAWHKRCLRCASCSKTLDSSNLFVSDDTPFCKKCHQQKSGLADTGYALRPSMF